MARWLTPLRAALVALAVGLLLGAGIRPGAVQFGERESTSLPESEARYRADSRLGSAFRRWRIAAVTDSVIHSIDGTTGAVQLRTGGGIPGTVSEVMEQSMASSPSPATAGSIPTIVAVVLDTLSAYDGREVAIGRATPEVIHVLPTVATDPCITIVILGGQPMDARGQRRLNRAIEGIVPGTCGIVSAFGLPGRHVRDWVVSTAGVPVRVWSRDPAQRIPADGMRPSMIDFLWSGALELDTEVRCFAGRKNACAQWMLHPIEAATGRLSLAGRDALVSSRYWRAQVPGHFASDLVLQQGTERFAAFWTSDLPVAEAYEAAFGEPLSSGVHGWVKGLGLGELRELASPLEPIVPILISMLLALGASLLYVSRRSVSA